MSVVFVKFLDIKKMIEIFSDQKKLYDPLTDQKNYLFETLPVSANMFK